MDTLSIWQNNGEGRKRIQTVCKLGDRGKINLDRPGGQAILDKDEFVDGLIDHLKKHKAIPDIPKSQRYVNLPSLEKIFSEAILRDRGKRDKKIVEAVEKHEYRQREVADHLGMYFTSVSRIMKRK